MKKLFVATTNTGKIVSSVKHLTEYGIECEVVKLDKGEPEVNDIYLIAKTKAERAYVTLNAPCIVNDSGFYIPSYPEEPYFPGAFVNRKLLVPLGIEGLLEKMKNVKNRECYFEDVVAYNDGNEIRYFTSLSKGTLSETIRGLDNPGQWSPLWHVFIPEGYDRTLSELSDEERNERSQNKTSSFKEFAKWYSDVIKRTI